MNKKTVGKVVSELQEKQSEKITIIDQTREMQKDYMNDLLASVDRGYKKYNRDFFIHVATKAEKLLPNVFRNYFIDRQTCPTPNYDQTVFRYNREKGQIEYIWTIPDRETAHHLVINAHEVVQEEKELLNFVLKFADGSLFKLCKSLNNEKYRSERLKDISGMEKS